MRDVRPTSLLVPQDAVKSPLMLATIRSRYGDLDLSLVAIPDFTGIMDEPATMWIDVIFGCL